ncbi:hypothetical protein M1555_03310 [Patescibacteria group bacterium]|nr:hypothetical protein [Patescibacteria group bacterium]
MWTKALWKKRLRRFSLSFGLTKRQQFVLVTGVLSFGLLLTQLVPIDLRYPLIGILSGIAYILCALVLREDLEGVEYLTLLTLPTLFTAAVGLFYFLLPVRWLTRVPVVVFYAVAMYALLLTENIYNVAANRSIALLRAAHSVGFLLTLVTFFLASFLLLSLRISPFVNSLGIGLLSFFLGFQSLWVIELNQTVSKRLWSITAALAIIFTELSWVFAFWPVPLILIALYLTTFFYGLVGMAQQHLVERLYKKTVIEFTSVIAIVSVVVMIATHWRGGQ